MKGFFKAGLLFVYVYMVGGQAWDKGFGGPNVVAAAVNPCMVGQMLSCDEHDWVCQKGVPLCCEHVGCVQSYDSARR